MSNKGVTAKGRREEQEARNELFQGAEEIHVDPTQIPLQDQTVDQLVNTAVRTHKDTTAIAQRALKVVEESKAVQAETMRQLDEQGRKADAIGRRIDELNRELTYAERLLSYMRRCCCCWWFDSCTGADPEERRKQDWQRRVARGETQVATGNGGPAARSSFTGGNGVGAAGRRNGANGVGRGGDEDAGPSGGMGNADIRLPDEFRQAEMGLHEETRKQNDTIDAIHAGLEQLLEGAKGMHDKLADGNKGLEGLDAKANRTAGRLGDVNKNSQLRNMARKPAKGEGEGLGSLVPTKAEAVAAATKRLAGL